jgi:glycine dehydrogenase
LNEFIPRHIGTIGSEEAMLNTIGSQSIDELVAKTHPDSIRLQAPLSIPPAVSVAGLLSHVKDLSVHN